MNSVLKTVMYRAGLRTLLVLILAPVLLVVMLGVTGSSDRILNSVINEELRQVRTTLSQTIRDPEELERVLDAKEEELVSLHGLDKPWVFRVPDTMRRLVTFDWGNAKTLRATNGSSDIGDIVLERVPRTLWLALPSFFLVTIIGIGVGSWLATKTGTFEDKFILVLSVLSLGLPAWWIGMILIWIFAYLVPIFPSGGMYSIPPPEGTFTTLKDLAWHAALPVITLTFASVGSYLYGIRTMVLRVAQEDFVSFARAKGFSGARVRWHHILRPAAPRIATGVVLGLALSVTGSILTEIVFRWPGMGLLYYEAVLGTPDEGLIVALTFLYTLLFVGALFVLEILYVLLDPRIRI